MMNAEKLEHLPTNWRRAVEVRRRIEAGPLGRTLPITIGVEPWLPTVFAIAAAGFFVGAAVLLYSKPGNAGTISVECGACSAAGAVLAVRSSRRRIQFLPDRIRFVGMFQDKVCTYAELTKIGWVNGTLSGFSRPVGISMVFPWGSIVSADFSDELTDGLSHAFSQAKKAGVDVSKWLQVPEDMSAPV